MAIQQPDLHTDRLLLRAFRMADADSLRSLAGDAEVARNTLNIPHPYHRTHAQSWIASHADQLQREQAVTYAVTRPDAGVVGAVGLILELEHRRAELGYWVGRPYWGQGYATEAARAVVAWGFADLDLHRIHAHHFSRNPASGRVLQKLGMYHEGRLREHVRKWGEYVDLEQYGILSDELIRPREAQ